MTLPAPLARSLALGLMLASCASRSAPIAYPPNAPSSAKALEAKPANVTLSLAGDPPYGEIKPDESAAKAHDPHMHHHEGHSHAH